MYRSIITALIGFMLTLNLAEAQVEKLFDKLYLIKINGEIIRYKASDEEPDYIKFKLKNNEWIKVDIDSILGYYVKDEPIQYLISFKSLKSGSKLTVNPIDYTAKDSTTYEFAERLLEGKIEVYQETTENYGKMNNGAGGTMYTSSTTYDVYAHIGNEYVQLYPVRKKDQEVIAHKFKKAISDDKYILEKVQHKKFKYNRDNVVELLEEYNLRAHRPVSFNQSDNTANAFIFRMNTQQTKEPIMIELGGSAHSLLPEDMIKVYIPTNKPVKMCIGNGNNQLCKLIMGSEYFDNSIELSQWKSGILRMKNEKLSPYQIINIEKAQEKRAKKALKAKTK